ncbi:MAG: DUF87 domain-containing protein [Oscillospiraceae bacterium]|nr:DUF87 domain-containing protein [Oscillospiraceae bacterium]
MGIKRVIKRAGGKVADAVARLSVLSPEQLQEMQQRREAYLTQMPSMDDAAAEELTRRLLAANSIEVYNEYLRHLKDFYVPVKKDAEYDERFKSAYNIRYFNITKWVTDKRENSLEKLVNVYDVLSNEECNIALVFHRTMTGTEIYLAVTNTQNARDNVDVNSYRKRLAEAIRGNFPGSEWDERVGKGLLPCMESDLPYSVACATNIPGEKSEKFISQTIEKLLDGIIPDSREKEYTLILLATPIQDVDDRKLHLAELYSGLAPYAGWQTNFTYTESDSTNSMATFGVNAGVSAGVQSGRNSSVANTSGTTDSTGETTTESSGTTTTESTGTTETQSTGSSITDSTGSSTTDTTGSSTSSGTSSSESSSNSHTIGSNTSEGTSSSSSNTLGGSLNESAGFELGIFKADVGATESYSHAATAGTSSSIGSSIADAVTSTTTQGITESVAQSASHAIGSSVGHAVTSSAGQAVAKSFGKAVAQNVGHAVAKSLGKAVTNSVTTASGLYKGVNFGGNFGANFARSSNVSATVGKNEGIQQSFINYTVKHTLEILEAQMKRLEQSTALGMWDFAAYVLSEDQTVANNVAHSYLALTQGESSYMSQAAVNLWRGDMGDDSENAKEISSYLKELRHPIFGLSPALTTLDSDFNAYPAIVTATTSLSGKELAYSLNFPQRSLAGFPVIECAEFGRNVVSYSSSKGKPALDLGCIFHMNHEESGRVGLTVQSLASHTFITGSTGAGKSNTVYHLIDEATEQGIAFLVIEPAKGEYKHYFGSDSDVCVYGTNPYLSPMLRINPFSFPGTVHVFEHLDRLVEIFNVCWPMYAAMPAILKKAIEQSYEDCGWDLMRSVSLHGEPVYPTFSDVARNIKLIIESSEYDTENKGAYKGSLLTRLQSLTTGISGTIFASDELESSALFDRNVIVDLSRVGSSETKALIMGMLVLKLQEYRMSRSNEANAGLKHITILEEAHNLLRKTSYSQSQDSANLMGKSVEMLSNAIAEMRTYGEGFIIVDQAPGLMDMAAIRNTNTKIIMRLPDQGDRELVGRAANLNDDQIAELAKLPCGVAAVYQNEWIQPVLCKVELYDKKTRPYTYTPGDDVFRSKETDDLSDSLLDYIMNKEIFRRGDREDLMNLKERVIRSKLDSAVKVDFVNYISSADEHAMDAFRKLLYDFLEAEKAIESAGKYSDISMWASAVVNALKPSVKDYSKRQINLALALLLYEQVMRDNGYNDLFCKFTEVYQERGGVF